MVLRVNNKKIIQNLLIYIMIIMNQSNLYKYFLQNYNMVLAAGLLLLILLFTQKHTYVVGFGIFLLADVFVTRIFVGDVGISAWINWIIKIGFCYIAISVNGAKFYSNYIKVVRFLAICSLVGYAIGVVFPTFFKSGLFIKYSTQFISDKTWISSNSFLASYHNSYGLLFYSFTEHETMRNIGIFTEAGVYQMVLISAIFILLFYHDFLDEKIWKQRTSTFLIIIVALLTCQSATGYIGLAVVMIAYLLDRNQENTEMKLRIVGLIGLMIAALLVDFFVRRNESLLGYTIIGKLINEAGAFDITADTGAYRYGMIMVALRSILNHPFGVGYDTLRYMANADSDGLVAAQIIQTGAVYGIPMLIGIVVWICQPLLKYEKKKWWAFLLIFLYFNTALAQSSEFYPVLIMFGMYDAVSISFGTRKIESDFMNEQRKGII